MSIFEDFGSLLPSRSVAVKLEMSLNLGQIWEINSLYNMAILISVLSNWQFLIYFYDKKKEETGKLNDGITIIDLLTLALFFYSMLELLFGNLLPWLEYQKYELPNTMRDLSYRLSMV